MAPGGGGPYLARLPGLQPPNPMKNGIHPDYKFISVRLSDGTTYQTRSTMSAERYHPEVDASNHPFYTGKKTIVDTAGRIDKFNRRYAQRAQGAESAPSAEAEGAETQEG